MSQNCVLKDMVLIFITVNHCVAEMKLSSLSITATWRVLSLYDYNLQGGPKKLTPFVLYALISSNIDRFSNLFRCLNQENICNNTVIKDPTTPQACHYTTL